VTLLPPALVQPIRDQMAVASQLHGKDLAVGLGEAYLAYVMNKGQKGVKSPLARLTGS